jgi:hypothetical protein
VAFLNVKFDTTILWINITMHAILPTNHHEPTALSSG